MLTSLAKIEHTTLVLGTPTLLRIWGIIRCVLSMQAVHLCWKTSFVPLMRCAFKINFKPVFLNLTSRPRPESKSVVADMFVCVFSKTGCRHMHLSHNPILWNKLLLQHVSDVTQAIIFNELISPHHKSRGTYLLLHLRCKILQPHQPFYLYLNDLIVELYVPVWNTNIYFETEP